MAAPDLAGSQSLLCCLNQEGAWIRGVTDRSDEAGVRSRLYIVEIVHGRRDLAVRSVRNNG